jgi:pimeloyl-ACP methyl ester carboxylesterase
LFSGTDFRNHLAAVDTPTLVIHGTSDATVPSGVSAQRTVAAMTDARVIEYDGAPHGLFYTEKDRLNADLLAFTGI